MKELTLEFPSGFVRSDTPDPGSILLQSSSFTLRFLPVQIGELSESMALSVKRRMHYAEDNTEASMELENTIPFGAEPQIKRKLRITDGLASMTMDLVMRNSCYLTSVCAGGFTLGGVISRIGFLTLDEKAENLQKFCWQDLGNIAEGSVLYEGEKPPLGISLETAAQRMDFMAGDDLWRWMGASRMNGKALFRVLKEKDSISCHWQLFIKNPPRNGEEDIPIPGKNWRITWAVAWKDLAAEKAAHKKPDPGKSFSLKSLRGDKRLLCKGGKRACLCANGTLNVLKKFVRSHLESIQEGEELYLTDLEVTLCTNAGHMDRAKQKELLHWDMMSLLDFVRWSNKALSRKGAHLTVLSPEGAPEKGFMILR